MKKIIITTPYGNKYEIDAEGRINGSDNWRLKGIEHVKKSWFIPIKDLTEKRLKELPLLYKNGNPQFTVRDLDHGTTRVWGNTKYHGIKSIYFK